MGLSMSVLIVTDEQIHDVERSPRRADALLARRIAEGGEACCYLHDYWGGLHYLLTGGEASEALPRGVLQGGEVRFSGASDPTWAVFSPTAQALAEALQVLTEADLRACYDPPSMLHPGGGRRPVYPGRFWAFPDRAEAVFRDLMAYFARLRAIVIRAAGEHHGLMFCRYEDW